MRERTQDRQTKHDASNPPPTRPGFDFVMERFGSIRNMDRSFDVAYWQRQGDAAIYRAAWELVELHQRDQGKDPDELRIQRAVEAFNAEDCIRSAFAQSSAITKNRRGTSDTVL
jgi:hypothetical protein